MKIFKILSLVFAINVCNYAYADDINSLYKDIHFLEQSIDKNPYDSFVLFKAKYTLSHASSLLNKCISQENTKVLELKKEMNYLDKVDSNLDLETLKKNKQIILKSHVDKLYLCKYLELKIANLNLNLERTNHDYFLKNLFFKDNNFLSSLKHFDKAPFSAIPAEFFFSNALQYKKILRIFQVLLVVSILLCGVQLQKKYRLFFPYLEKINTLKLVRALCIYSMTSSLFYLILYLDLFQKNDVLRIISRPISWISAIAYIYSLYIFIKPVSYIKDITLGLFVIFLNIVFLFFSYESLYFKLLSYSTQQVLLIKYFIFILLQPIQIFVLYFCLNKILNIKLNNIYLKIGIISSVLTIFMGGLCGYLNFATHLNFVIILDMISLTRIYVFLRLWKKLINSLDAQDSKLYQYMKKKFKEQTASAILKLKFLGSILVIICSVYDVLLMLYLTTPFINDADIAKIYDLLYGSRLLGTIDYSIIQLVAGVLLFIFLSLLNYIVSSNLARKVYIDPKSRSKTTKIFIGIGYIINIFAIIFIINIHVENLVVISGGLLLGLGIALQSGISKIFSSVILYLHPPFRVGDYIEIQNTKGYVKKITFLETFIETSDNNTIILPNQLIASSVIENFNYENKNFQKIHINYILNDINLNQEELIKSNLRKILLGDSNVIEDKQYPIAFIFSLFSLSPETYHLEIIFCYKKQHDLKHDITQLNRQIAASFKSIKIGAKFESMNFPLI